MSPGSSWWWIRRRSRAASRLEGKDDRVQLVAEDEIDGAAHAKRGPQIVELDRLAQKPDRERDKDAECDHLLQDLELGDVETLMADPVRRHLQQVFEEGDAPTDERRHVPGLAIQSLQMPVPGEGHEDVRRDQQQRGLQEYGSGHSGILTRIDGSKQARSRDSNARPRRAFPL